MEVTPKEQVRIRGQHLPGLDGLRALAVLGVVAYHLHLRFMAGGYLGVDLFFVLSGFLITSLLIEERESTGSVAFGSFWARRAKRLLPALFVMLAVVSVYVAITSHFALPGARVLNTSTLRGDAVATLLYVSNWHLIASSQGYFNHFAFPSPLEHTWSLAIEEQFYVVFPLVVVGLVALVRRDRSRRVISGLLLVAALLSLIEMAVLYDHGSNLTRIYFGTDTRAFDLLIGAALAFGITAQPRMAERPARVLGWLAWPSGVVLAGFWILSGNALEVPRPYMFRGGFALCAVLAALVIAAVVERPHASAPRALSWRPLVAVGAVSYGIYLWHWPVIVLINPLVTGTGRLATDVIRLMLIALLTIASYVLIERPVRRRALPLRRVAGIFALTGAVTALLVVVLSAPFVLFPPGTEHVVTYPVVGVPPSGQVPGEGGFAGQVPIDVGHHAARANPLRVGFIGDSLMRLSYAGISAALRSTGVITTSTAARPGWGLTSQGARLGPELQTYLSRERPDLVVGTWIWDNQVASVNPAGYEALLNKMVTDLTDGPSAARGVLLIPFPTIEPPPTLDSMPGESLLLPQFDTTAFNRIARQVAASHPGKVMILPVSDSVLLPGRRFTAWLPPGNQPSAPRRSWVRVRWTDGIHLCQNGTVRFATALAADLHVLAGTPQAHGSWWRGAWTTSADYRGGAGGATVCPADHPSS